MLLSVIIVNFNTSIILQECLRALYKSILEGNYFKKTEVMVIDNASKDQSVAIIRKKFPQVKLICNEKNVGFAMANNQGIKQAIGQYILLLNSDAILTSTSLNNLLSEFSADNKIGVVGGKLLNRDNSIQPSVGFFPHLGKVFLWSSFLDDLPYTASILKPYHVTDLSFYAKRREVDWVSGAVFMINAKILTQAQVLDENIFMYGEEVEWCYRIKKSGFKIIYTPEAKVYHLKGGSSSGETAGIVKEFEGIIYFYRKHKANWQLSVLKLFLVTGALLRFLFFGIIMRQSQKRVLYAQAIQVARR